MRLEYDEYKYGYTLNTDGLSAIVDLSKQIASSIDLEKGNIDVFFSLSFEDDTHIDKAKITELEIFLNRNIYNDKIKQICIYSRYSLSSELPKFKFVFDKEWYSYLYIEENEDKFISYKDKICKLFQNEIENKKFYNLLAGCSYWFYPVISGIIYFIIVVLTHVLNLNEITRNLTQGVSFLLMLFSSFISKLFPKNRILIGSKNIKVYEDVAKKRKILWGFVVYPFLTFLIEKITEYFLY